MPVLEEHSIRVTGDVGSAEDAMRRLAESVDQKLDGITKSVSNMGTVIAADFVQKIGNSIKEASEFLLSIGESFDSAFDRIRIGTGATDEKLQELQESFRKISTTVPSQLEDVSIAITKLHQLTGATGKGLEDLAVTQLNLARITGANLGTQVEGTTRLFNKWKISVDQQSGSLDFLFKVSQHTGSSIDRISGLMTRAATPLKNLGFSFQTTAALIGQMDKAGINVDGVMMGLTKSFAKLAKAGKDPEQAFDALIKKIKSAKTESEATKIALGVFGARAGGEFAAAVRSGALSLDILLSKIKGSDETINKAAAETADFAEQWQIFKNKVITALEPLGAAIFGALGKLVDFIQPIIPVVQSIAEAFKSLSPGIQATIAVIGALATIAGPLIVIIGQVAGSIASISALFGGAGAAAGIFGGALTALTGPVGIIIAAVAALGIAYATNFLGIRDIVNSVVSSVVSFLGVLVDGVKKVIEIVGPIWLQMWGKFKSTVLEALQPIIKAIQDHKDIILPILGAIAIALTGPIGAIIALALAWENNWGHIREVTTIVINAVIGYLSNFKGVFKAIWDAVIIIIKTSITVISDILASLINIFSAIVKVFQGDWAGAWEDLKSAAANIWDAIIALISGAAKLLGTLLRAAWELLKAEAKIAWEALGTVIQVAWDALGTFLLSVVPRTIGQVIAFFLRLPDELPGLVAKAWELVKGAFSKGQELIVAAATAIWGALKEWTEKVPELILAMGEAIVQFLLDLPAKVAGVAKDIGAAIWSAFQEGLGVHSPSGPEKDVMAMSTGVIETLTSMSGKVGGPAEKIGATIHEKFLKGFKGLTKSTKEALDEWISQTTDGLKLTASLWANLGPTLQKNLLIASKAVQNETNAINKVLLAHVASVGRVFEIDENEWKKLPVFVQKHIQATHQTVRVYGAKISTELGTLAINTALNTDKILKSFEVLNREVARKSAELAATGFNASREQIVSLTLILEKLNEAARKFDLAPMAGQLKHTEEEFLALKDAFGQVIERFASMADELKLTGEAKIAFVLEKIRAILKTLPDDFKETAEKSLAAWRKGQDDLITQNDKIVIAFKEQFDHLSSVVGVGLALVIAHILQAFDKLNTAVFAKWSKTAEGIVTVLTNIPGGVGEKLARVTNVVLDWINKLDNIFKGLHKIWDQIPDGLGPVIQNLIGMFKGASTSIGTSLGSITAGGAKVASGAKTSAGTLIDSWGKAGDGLKIGLNAAAGAFASLVTAMTVTAATGSKTAGIVSSLFTSTLAGIQAGLAFGPVGGAIVGGVSLLGGIIGAFMGKSPLQKAQEAAALQKAKDDIKLSQEAVIQAVEKSKQTWIETLDKSRALLESIQFYTKVPKVSFQAFFKDVGRLFRNIIDLAKEFSGLATESIKQAAENMKPAVEMLAALPAVFDGISSHLKVPDLQFESFFADVATLIDHLAVLMEEIPRKVRRHARQFSDSLGDAFKIIPDTINALGGLIDIQDVPDTKLDILQSVLERLTLRLGEIAGNADKFLLKTIQFFAEKMGNAVDLLKSVVDLIRAMVDLPMPTDKDFSNLFSSLDKGLEMAIDTALKVSQDTLPLATAVWLKIKDIFSAVNEGVSVVKAIAEAKWPDDAAWTLFTDALWKMWSVLQNSLDIILKGKEISARIKDETAELADNIIEAASNIARALTMLPTIINPFLPNVNVTPPGIVSEVSSAAALQGSIGDTYHIEVHGSLIHESELENLLMSVRETSRKRGRIVTA